MKTIKRNAVIIAVLLFVCLAVYLNWSYNNSAVSADTEGEIAETEAPADTARQAGTEDGLFYTASEASGLRSDLKEYFDTVRLNRRQAKDEAAATLNTVAAAEGATQETVDEALAQMSAIAAWTLQESELESMIMAKGFQECVAYISADGVSVTVAAPDGLSNADVAKITDIVLNETDFTAEQLKIVEIK